MSQAPQPQRMGWGLRVVDIAALILLAPTVLLFGFYLLSERMMQQWHYIPEDVTRCIESLGAVDEATYRCRQSPTHRRSVLLIPPDVVNDCTADIPAAISGFNRPGFLGFRGDLMYAVRDVPLPFTEQFFAANEFSDKLRGRVSVWSFHHKKLCQAASPRDLEEVQRKAGAQVVAFREELQRRWTPVKEAMARYQKNRLKVALLAWSLFLFELVAFLWGSWFYVRRYLAKQRTAGAG